MSLWFLAPIAALAAGCLALAPLGVQVLQRGVVFIDLAVAQAAAAAAIWADVLWHDPGHAAEGVATQVLAVLGELACTGVVMIFARRRPAQREALIGLIYVSCACLAVLGARHSLHGHERLTELLAADVLWAGWSQVGVLAAAAALLWLLLALRVRLSRDAVFYPLFALAASLAVPVLGLFVVFACLIAPALWVRTGLGLPRAALLAVLAAIAGLGVSWMADLPSGATVAIALSLYRAASAVPGGPDSVSHHG